MNRMPRGVGAFLSKHLIIVAFAALWLALLLASGCSDDSLTTTPGPEGSSQSQETVADSSSPGATTTAAPTTQGGTTENHQFSGTPPAFEGTTDSDREALVAFFHATNGPDWQGKENWLNDAHLDRWEGVVTDADGRVTGLHLPGNQLGGELPPELGQLTRLEYLILQDNQIGGELPLELGNLTLLKEINLSLNNLTGPIPPDLGNITLLEKLDLRSNLLTGPIQPEVGNLTFSRVLDLGRNDLTGEIPPELGNLVNLRTLNLSDNSISGEIPAELGNLSSLQYLFLGGNSLNGCIPEVFSWMRGMNLGGTGLCFGGPYIGVTPTREPGPTWQPTPEACVDPLRIPPDADPAILALAREAISEHPRLEVTHQAVQDGWVAELYGALQSPDFVDRDLLAFTMEVLKYDRKDVGGIIDSIHLLYPRLADDREIEDLFMLKMSHGLLVHTLFGMLSWDTWNDNEWRIEESKDFYNRLSAMFSQSAHIGRKYDSAHLEAATVLAGYLLGDPEVSSRPGELGWYREEGAELVTQLYEGFIPVLEDSYGDPAPKISDIISGTRAEVAAPTQAYEAPGSSDPTPTLLPTPEPLPEPWTEYLDFADSELLTLAARIAARPAYQESYGMSSTPNLAPLDIEDRIERKWRRPMHRLPPTLKDPTPASYELLSKLRMP